jgi:hypothetical protein
VPKIIDKFEKKTLLKKVIPPLIEVMKDPTLSPNVLTIIFNLLAKDKYVTTTEFRYNIWPGLVNLCKSKELPAKTLFLLLQHASLILKFVSSGEFCQNLMPLIAKSLDCGVPKLQLLALD